VRLWWIQFLANAILIAIFYEWLGIRDSRISQLILSAFVGVILIGGIVWLHSDTFHVKPRLRFALMLTIFALLYWGLASLPLDKAALSTASTLTFRSRKPTDPAAILAIMKGARWVCQWIIIPLILLHRKQPGFWMRFAGIALVAFLIPRYLVGWTPKLTGTGPQVASFLLRFGLAYCLAITGFVAFSRLTSSGSPEVSHPMTAPLP
jgi:predicted lysophospholipase L1 biosynthesis ABC-type transport system permease subunit